MQEAKQTFPGNTISDGLFKLSAFTFAFLFFVSATEGRFQSGTEFFGIDGTYFHLVGLAMVATLLYQHKAVFTKKAGEGKVHFWKQFTPYFVYARREIDVKDLSYWIKKTTSTDTETGRSDSSYRTYVYEGNKKIFVYDDKTDYFREILGKGPRRANDEMDLGMKIFLPILFVVGVGFLVVGAHELYSALTGSESDGDLFFSWGLPSLYTLLGAFFIIIPCAIAWSEFSKRRFIAADPVTPNTPLHDAEEWWGPKSRLEREEVDLVIKNASAGEIRASVLLLGAFALMGIPVVLGGVFILAVGALGLSSVLFLAVSGPIGFQTAVLSLFFLTTLPGIFLFGFYQGFKTMLATEVKWVLASRRGAMEIHYVSWRGLVDIVHLEATEITAIHQTTHPSWAGPPTDAYIIAGWKIFRVPLHDDASRLCEVLGIELDRAAPNLADLYVKQGDMSGNRPREVSGDAEFEGIRDRQRPFGMWFLSVFVWAIAFFLSLFMEASGFDEGPLLVTGLVLWVTWKMFSFAFSRPVLKVLNTEGRLVVVNQYFVRARQLEEWPIAEASHIVAKGKSKPDQTNEGWFTLVGVNTEGGKWGPAWEYDLAYLLPRRNDGDVVEEASMAMRIAGGISDAIGIPIVTRPYEKMKVQQLKEEAQGRGLEVGGRKADLVSRLYESDAMARQG